MTRKRISFATQITESDIRAAKGKTFADILKEGYDDYVQSSLALFKSLNEKRGEVIMEEIQTAFTYHPVKEGQAAKYTQLRDHAKGLAMEIVSMCPDSRERALAITKLEEAIMWANAAIARRS